MALPFTPTLTTGAGGAVQTTQTTPAATSTSTSSTGTLPASVTNAAAQAPTNPNPVYHGPAINSVPHVASLLGASYVNNPQTKTGLVNGTPIQPLKVDSYGVPHASVVDIASAAKYDHHLIQPTSGGNIQIMPKTHVQPAAQSTPVQNQSLANMHASQMVHQAQVQNTANTPTRTAAQNQNLATMHANQMVHQQQMQNTGDMQPATGTQPSTGGNVSSTQTNTSTTNPGASGNGTLNPYWQGAQQHGGYWQAPINGETAQQLKTDVATKFGINPSQVQVDPKSGHAFVAWQYIANHAYAQSAAEAAANQQQFTGTDVSQISPYLQQMQQVIGQQQTPGIAQGILGMQLPSYSFDPNQAAQQAFATENPIFQSQMAGADQKINDSMNRRGMYNSGIAQQMVNQQDAAITQNLDNAINKDMTTYQANAIKQYQAQLSAYNDQVGAAYKAGQLTDTQYAQEITALNDAMTQLTNASKGDTTALANIGLGVNPTTGQLTPTLTATNDAQTQALNVAKFQQSVYQFSNLSAQQQAQMAYNYWKSDLPYQQLTADQQQQLAYNYQKLNFDIGNAAQQNQIRLDSVMGVDQNGNPTLDRQKLGTQIQQWAQQDALKADSNSISQRNLTERINHDAAMAQLASDNSSTKIEGTQLTGLHEQLVSAGETLKNLIGTAQAKQVNPQTNQTYYQDAVNNYNAVYGQITTLVKGMGSSNSQLPGFFSPANQLQNLAGGQ